MSSEINHKKGCITTTIFTTFYIFALPFDKYKFV